MNPRKVVCTPALECKLTKITFQSSFPFDRKRLEGEKSTAEPSRRLLPLLEVGSTQGVWNGLAAERFEERR